MIHTAPELNNGFAIQNGDFAGWDSALARKSIHASTYRAARCSREPPLPLMNPYVSSYKSTTCLIEASAHDTHDLLEKHL
ncbi:hypothetical protein LSAT2_004228 [Lamellibrachia satsuma]|nr:hypothetical protein LSAT2_004228 [Lamellibrachia satsuma]